MALKNFNNFLFKIWQLGYDEKPYIFITILKETHHKKNTGPKVTQG
jgi:hypothetical protein